MDQNQNVRLEGTSSPWKWLLPLLLLIVLGVAVYAFTRANDTEDTQVNQNQQQNNVATTSTSTATQSQEDQAITNIADIYSVTDSTALNGVRVAIKDATVARVTGDKTFFIGTAASTTQQVLVYISNQSATTANDTQVKVGDKRNITGVIRPLPNVQSLQTTWKATATELNAFKNVKVYIDATMVGTTTAQ